MSFEAQDLINQAIRKHKDKICVNWSGGRDSTVVLHMALEENPHVNVIFANTLCEVLISPKKKWRKSFYLLAKNYKSKKVSYITKQSNPV
jgi:3'-phosphoadenosine 5'-phosphosulfate sulfotransferase (PAPS reductase)/FAD synthetase